MEELLLINPSKRGKRKTKSRKHRSAAQRAATRRLVALNRSRRAGSSSPKRRRSARRSTPITYAANPVRRRRRAHSTHRRVSTRRYRRNPTGLFGNLVPMVTDAAIGAAGAIAVDVAVGLLPLPANLKTGLLGTVTRGAAAVALGTVGGMIMPRRVAKQMAAGSLTVTAYGALKGFLATNVPALGLSGMGYYPGGLTAPAIRQLPNLRAPAPNATRRGNALSEYIRRSELGGMSVEY